MSLIQKIKDFKWQRTQNMLYSITELKLDASGLKSFDIMFRHLKVHKFVQQGCFLGVRANSQEHLLFFSCSFDNHYKRYTDENCWTKIERAFTFCQRLRNRMRRFCAKGSVLDQGNSANSHKGINAKLATAIQTLL